MKKLFNNVIFLRIIITILLIVSSYLIIMNNKYSEYTYKVMDENLEKGMRDVANLNRAIKVFVKRKNNNINVLELDSIEKLINSSKDVEELLDLIYYSFNWRDIRNINRYFKKVLKKDKITKEDIKHIRNYGEYLDRLENLYENEFKGVDTIIGRYNYFKHYKIFIERGTNLFNSDEYYEIEDYFDE